MGCGLGSTYISQAAQLKDAVITAPKLESGVGALNLIATQTLASAARAITFSSLTTYTEYLLVWSATSDIAGAKNMSMYFNADTTEGNYHELYIVNGASGTGNNAVFTTLNQNEDTDGYAIIKLSASGHVFANIAHGHHTNLGGGVSYLIKDNATVASITAISLSHSDAVGWKAGSTATLYGIG